MGTFYSDRKSNAIMEASMTEHSFDRVYADFKGKVWQLIARYVRPQADREDLFQEVFLNIHRALPRFRGDSQLETWIYRVAVNTSLNFIKKQKRNKLITDALSVLRPIEPEAPAEDELDLKPLEKLNPQQRAILLLAEVEEKKLEEIAQIMKLPLGTVKSNLHRAKEILRKELGENGKI